MKIEGEKNPLQQNEDWKIKKMGRFSCSQLWRLMGEPKNKSAILSDGAITYIMECIAEKLTGKPAKDDFTSKYTEWGIENEPIAIGIYEEVFGVKSTQTGYIPHGENFGGSPDRLLEDGFIEAKCPYTITAHLMHLLSEVKDIGKGEYYWQCIGYFIVTEAKFGDFISYHPHYPGKHQFKRKRLTREDVQPDIDRAILKINQSTEFLKSILNLI